MSDLRVNCTNQDCNSKLVFSREYMGSIQSCPNCGVELLIPKIEPKPYASPTNQPFPSPYEAKGIQQAPITYSGVTEDGGKRTRKVRVGSGCLAMMAVMFAFAILVFGYSLMFDITPGIYGLFVVMTGIAGIGAFAYFGYFAQETENNYRDERKSR